MSGRCEPHITNSALISIGFPCIISPKFEEYNHWNYGNNSTPCRKLRNDIISQATISMIYWTRRGLTKKVSSKYAERLMRDRRLNLRWRFTTIGVYSETIFWRIYTRKLFLSIICPYSKNNFLGDFCSYLFYNFRWQIVSEYKITATMKRR